MYAYYFLKTHYWQANTPKSEQNISMTDNHNLHLIRHKMIVPFDINKPHSSLQTTKRVIYAPLTLVRTTLLSL